MMYGYSRVSTVKQDKFGNSLEEQEEQLRAAGCTKLYHDSFTGTKMDRPEFTNLISALKAGDTLVVTKLDRFARNASDGAKLMQELLDRGVKVNVLNMGMADNTPMGRLMVHILFAFAEFERDQIVERTMTGKAVARAKGKRVDGRPAITLSCLDGFTEAYASCVAGLTSVKDECARLGISRSTWYKLAREYALKGN